eukprot:6225273-Prymnesium_polylepis.1
MAAGRSRVGRGGSEGARERCDTLGGRLHLRRAAARLLRHGEHGPRDDHAAREDRLIAVAPPLQRRGEGHRRGGRTRLDDLIKEERDE